VNHASGANAEDGERGSLPPERKNVTRDERHIGAGQDCQQSRDPDEREQPWIAGHGRTGEDVADGRLVDD
jgi:hypothetical protein